MTRWAYCALTALLSLPALISAAPEQKNTPELAPPAKQVPAADDSVANRDEFQLDADSEVLLDGLPSRYEDVPPNAIIQRLQVARDGSIVRIEFRSRKK